MAQIVGFVNLGQHGRVGSPVPMPVGLAQAALAPLQQPSAGLPALPWAAAALAAGAAAVFRRKQVVRRGCAACRAASEGAAAEGTAKATAAKEGNAGLMCGPCGGLPLGRRNQLALLGGLAAAPSAAWAEGTTPGTTPVTKTNCIDCAGEGFIQCRTCKGSGSFKLFGLRAQTEGNITQFVDCPECNGVGVKLCVHCFGTGLPSTKLKGFMRDQGFKKVLYRLKRQKIDLDTLPKMKDEVKEAVEAVEQRMAAPAEV
mmetsp:Transcript_64458/g.203774  ORF Transcript_64458/g.203774 Transcript_64458/m.203774 type:complete len:257 (+) Transcript_64458:1-771(+)